MFEKEEDLAKKDVIIKNLTQKQLEFGDAMNKFQKFLDAHNDLKRQLENANRENERLRDLRDKLQRDLQDSN